MPDVPEQWDINTPEGMESAKRWLANHLNRIKDGGFWIIPRTGGTYRIHHSVKVAELIGGGRSDSSTEKVLEAMGWTVTRPQ